MFPQIPTKKENFFIPNTKIRYAKYAEDYVMSRKRKTYGDIVFHRIRSYVNQAKKSLIKNDILVVYDIYIV